MPSLVFYLDTICPNEAQSQPIYNTLSGRTMQDQPFWQAFKESAKRRNAVVHKGAGVTKEQAEETQRAATELVAYLKG